MPVIVTIEHSPLAFFYGLFRPNIQVDGGPIQKTYWGSHTLALLPGRHTIAISYPWLFSPECGRNEVTFDLAADDSKHVRYHAPLIRYLPGKMTIESS